MQLLRVLYLPPSPASITYRPWAAEREEIPLLRWFVERLAARYGIESLLVACHDEIDRLQAEEALGDLGVFVVLCAGDTLLAALGELAAVFPSRSIAYFHVEMMFAPSDLLDRVADHHQTFRNDFTGVCDLPPLLAPEIAVPGLLAALASVNFEGSIPSPAEAVRRLCLARNESSSGPPLRATPFTAGAVYSLPKFPRVSSLQTADDAQRARQALADLPSDCEFEALDRWHATTFDPLVGLTGIAPGDPARPKLLYLSPGSLYSGAEECLRGLAQGLAPHQIQQTAVVGLEGLLAQNLRQAGCQVISANWYFSAPPAPDASVRHACDRYAAAVLDRIQPDFIHCNGNPGPAFIREAQQRGRPLVAHVRTATLDGFGDLFAAAAHVIAVSNFVKGRLQEAGVPDRRITVVYDGVDIDRFSPGAFDKITMRRKFDLPAEAFVAVMIARVVPSKRHDLMIEAFARLLHYNPSARLVLIGLPGDLRALHSLHTSISKLPRPASVTVLPFQTDIREIECAADAVVLPSDAEALGTCILEAMSLGIPTIVSDNGGTCELIEHGVSGLAMSGGDATSLTAALNDLLCNADLRKRLAREGRKRAELYFTLGEHARQVKRVLFECAGITY